MCVGGGGGGGGGLNKRRMFMSEIWGTYLFFIYCWGEGLFLKGLIFGIYFYDPMTE